MKKFSFKPNKRGWIVIAIIGLLLLLLTIKNRKSIKNVATKAINYLKEKTWDLKTEKVIAGLHPIVRAKVKEFIIRAEKELGIKLRAYSGHRSWNKQTGLFNQPFDKKDNDGDGLIDERDEKVTNAKAGESYHNFGLAIDVVEIKNGKALWNNPNWEKIAALGRSIGFEWGGDWKSFKDKPHFQYTFGHTLAELRRKYNSGQRSGEFVNLT